MIDENLSDEGSIRFHCEWHHAEPPEPALVQELLAARDRMFDLGLIGVLPDGVGYGNASIRLDHERFIITGSGSGGVARLGADMLTIVTAVAFEGNSVVCHGPVVASSESMTHAALYHVDPAINCVLHLHDGMIWNRLRDIVPTTRSDVPYGTPAMAAEVSRLYREERAGSIGIVVMGGHRDGFLCFGTTVADAERAVAAAVDRTTI